MYHGCLMLWWAFVKNFRHQIPVLHVLGTGKTPLPTNDSVHDCPSTVVSVSTSRWDQTFLIRYKVATKILEELQKIENCSFIFNIHAHLEMFVCAPRATKWSPARVQEEKGAQVAALRNTSGLSNSRQPVSSLLWRRCWQTLSCVLDSERKYTGVLFWLWFPNHFAQRREGVKLHLWMWQKC